MASLQPKERDATKVIVMNEPIPPCSPSCARRACGCSIVHAGSRDPRYLARLLKDVGSGPVIVHAHNRGSKFWAMLLRMLRPRTRLVFTVHAMHIVEAYGAFHRAVHNRLVDCTVAILALSRPNAKRVAFEMSKLCATASIFAVPHLARNWMCRLERELIAPVIVTVARLVHAIKGQDVLIEAVARLKQRGSQHDSA